MPKSKHTFSDAEIFELLYHAKKQYDTYLKLIDSSNSIEFIEEQEKPRITYSWDNLKGLVFEDKGPPTSVTF